MIVHFVDGTYELFRHFYGLRRFNRVKGCASRGLWVQCRHRARTARAMRPLEEATFVASWLIGYSRQAERRWSGAGRSPLAFESVGGATRNHAT